MTVSEVLLGLGKHIRRGIKADEGYLLVQVLEVKEGCAQGTPQIIDIRVVYGKIRGDFGDHALDLGVERDRAAQHIVEHFGRLAVKGKIIDLRSFFGKQAVRSHTVPLLASAHLPSLPRYLSFM